MTYFYWQLNPFGRYSPVKSTIDPATRITKPTVRGKRQLPPELDHLSLDELAAAYPLEEPEHANPDQDDPATGTVE